MTILVVIGIAVGLAMDAFAVAVGASASLGRITRGQVFRFAFHFGLFQAAMPIVGWLAGRSLNAYIQTWDHWLAFGLLAFIGGKAIITALKSSADAGRAPYSPAATRSAQDHTATAWPGVGDTRRSDPTRGLSLLVLSVATSIDALAVGLTLGVLGNGIWLAALIIGLVTAALTTFGMHLGSRLGGLFGRRFSRVTEIVGGLVLIGIGAKILIQHLT
ncbi:MAG: manganese efflux pump [Verrucomicrobia bacterium]|nr:manganese efflux pump [Verrucomicrobiota bacterium]